MSILYLCTPSPSPSRVCDVLTSLIRWTSMTRQPSMRPWNNRPSPSQRQASRQHSTHAHRSLLRAFLVAGSSSTCCIAGDIEQSLQSANVCPSTSCPPMCEEFEPGTGQQVVDVCMCVCVCACVHASRYLNNY